MQLKKPVFTLFISLAMFNGFTNAEDSTQAEDNFRQGQIFHENDEINAAIEEFTKAISKSPNTSRYHHWLAKSYGELAEKSSWFEAMRLAEDSMEYLELAVELDPENIKALEDLMKYYKEAPGFLGGGDEKAEEISLRLKDLTDKNTDPLEIP